MWKIIFTTNSIIHSILIKHLLCSGNTLDPEDKVLNQTPAVMGLTL